MSHVLYQQMILDHSKKPKGFSEKPEGCCAKGHNPLCGDWLKLCITMDEKIEKVEFFGEGCSISIAAASVLVDVVKGLTKEEFLVLKDKYIAMLKGESVDLPSKLKMFSGIVNYPLRVKCASFAWHALSHALEKQMYPLLLTPEVESYWAKLVKTQGAEGIEIDFKQVGCYGWQFIPTVKNEGEGKAFVYDGFTLWIKEALIPKVQGTRVLYVEKDLGQAKVEFVHPKAKQHCGCGESFELEDDE